MRKILIGSAAAALAALGMASGAGAAPVSPQQTSIAPAAAGSAVVEKANYGYGWRRYHRPRAFFYIGPRRHHYYQGPRYRHHYYQRRWR